MGRLTDVVYRHDPVKTKVYNALYAEYLLLHDYFGRGENNVMKRLRAIRERQSTGTGREIESIFTKE